MHTLIGSDQYGQILTLAIPIEKVVGGQGEKVVLGVVRWGGVIGRMRALGEGG